MHRMKWFVDDQQQVPCVGGEWLRYVNLDNAASTQPLVKVCEAVEAFLPWYSSVHRGAGFKSQVASSCYERARDAVREFVDAREDDLVVFVRNTTEAINLLAHALPAGSRVLSSPVEHHANMLPWRSHHVEVLPFAASADELLEAIECALRSAGEAIDLVAITGASNVTGEIWPIAQIAELAHRYAVEVFVDVAQLAAHRAISVKQSGIDYLAFSGHKLYAPFGAGALVARARCLPASPPLLKGGGAIEFVTLDDVVSAAAPDRHEAGSPNVVGVVALGAACDALMQIGMDAVARHERVLAQRLWTGLDELPLVEQLRTWPADVDRVGVATFNLAGYRHPLLACVLAAEHAIGVRNGCFCAHPLITHLLGISPQEAESIRADVAAGDRRRMPGAVRASIGLATCEDDVDALLGALSRILESGPAWNYDYDSARDEYRPSPDARCWPALPMRMGTLNGPRVDFANRCSEAS
jgi:selenocysteine lyase/cysteine desulfurase